MQGQFDTINMVPALTSSQWALHGGASISSSGKLIIPSGGSADVVLSSISNKAFNSLKTVIDVNCAGIENTTNFENKAYIDILNMFKSKGTNEVDSVQRSALAVNSFSLISGDHYRDTNILSATGQVISLSLLAIFNFTDTTMIVNSLGLYTSSDINTSQLNDAINNATSSLRASHVDFILDRANDGVVGFEVTNATSSTPDTYNFLFDNDRLTGCTTNFGYNLTIGYKYAGGVTEDTSNEGDGV